MANPTSAATAASGSSNSMWCASSPVGGQTSTSTRRSGSSVSAWVNTTSRNWADRSGSTANRYSTPPETLSLLSTTEAASARKAPTITLPNLPLGWVSARSAESSCVVGMLLVHGTTFLQSPGGRRSRPARQKPIVAGMSLTSTGSDIAPVPPVTSSTQRPLTGRRSWISKNANPGNSATAASGASKFRRIGSSSVGGLISTVMSRSELSGSACVNTTNTNRASRSGPTANLDSTPPRTLSLLSTAAAASAKNAPVSITPLNLPRRRWTTCPGVARGGSALGDKLFSATAYLVFYFVSADYILLLLSLPTTEFLA
ncbi:conserved exported hypothetical protein [Mycobacterium tuberculosis]|nr:conserved exported hypothetical protein [Mycobacterium tuberculosis]